VLNVDDPQYKLPEQNFFTHFGKMFKDNKGLRKISMRQHRLRFEGVSILTYYLQDNSYLEVLDLSANQICFQGMMYLSEYLESTKTLKSIILAGNKIKEAGIENYNLFLIGAKHFARGIYKNQSIVHVDLTNNSINNEGLCRIAEGLSTNNFVQSLKIFLNNEWGDESISMFKTLLSNKGTDFYPDFVIYETETLETDIAYLETHIKNEEDYLV